MLTASWSKDGSYWNEAFSFDLGTQLDGLDQKVVLAGNSWFNSLGAYANYDYVSLNAVPEPATMSLLAIGGLALIRKRRRA